MPAFNVCIVPQELLSLWRERWERDHPTKRAMKVDADGSLSQSVTVAAKDKWEAAKVAEAEHPSHLTSSPP